MSQAFAAPGAPSGGIEWGDHLGRLLLVTVHAAELGVNTVHGVKDAIRADVVVLDGPDSPDVFEDTLIFPRVLIGQLRSRVGAKVLGRLIQGTAKSGQKPPWILSSETTEVDEKVALAYIAGTVTKPDDDGEQPPF